MRLIVGLGNPGEKYKNNRHNVGHMVIDVLAIKNSKQMNNQLRYKIFKSKNFMNQSGEFVKKLVEQYGIKTSELWVIHDDLDIPLGSYKIQNGRGPKVHHGVNSIEETLREKDFWRVRIGVDNREPGDRIAGEDYVLQDFTETEKNILNEVIQKVSDELYGKLFKNK